MPLDLESLLTTERVTELTSVYKPDVLEEMILLMGRSDRVDDLPQLREKVLERESKISTGVGMGIAIPHVKISTIRDFVMAVGVSREGIDFDSLDKAPTHIVVMIGCNVSQSGEFLKVLSRLVSGLRDPMVQEAILDAKSPQVIRDLFVGPSGIFTPGK
ncbi:MAG: PTS sugar transporter subunit IIA [Candidatus Sumerlaeia bacterium]|nr:PTS sugar transporter subunit IIA [Candidatus Sumerlaeia bacterium]